jgi:hypothetical protein
MRDDLGRQPNRRIGDIGAPGAVAVGRQVFAVIRGPLPGLREAERIDITAGVDDLRQISRQILHAGERLVGRRRPSGAPRRVLPKHKAAYGPRWDFSICCTSNVDSHSLGNAGRHAVPGHVVAKLDDQADSGWCSSINFSSAQVFDLGAVDRRSVHRNYAVRRGRTAVRSELHPVARLRPAHAVGLHAGSLVHQRVVAASPKENLSQRCGCPQRSETTSPASAE